MQVKPLKNEQGVSKRVLNMGKNPKKYCIFSKCSLSVVFVKMLKQWQEGGRGWWCEGAPDSQSSAGRQTTNTPIPASQQSTVTHLPASTFQVVDPPSEFGKVCLSDLETRIKNQEEVGAEKERLKSDLHWCLTTVQPSTQLHTKSCKWERECGNLVGNKWQHKVIERTAGEARQTGGGGRKRWDENLLLQSFLFFSSFWLDLFSLVLSTIWDLSVRV